MKALLKKYIPLGIIGLIGANLVGWSIYELLKIWVSNGLASVGIVSPVHQSLVIIGVGTGILIIAGVKLKEILD